MLKESLLGIKTEYATTYSPELLFPIPRALGRGLIDINETLPFHGYDVWNGFELSWLNSKGKPEIAIAEFYIPCTSPNIVESKSFKLYLNSLNQTRFASFDEVKKTLEKDLSRNYQSPVEVKLFPPSQFNKQTISHFSGISLDELDIETTTYELQPDFLITHNQEVEESLYSHLLKSNCLATGQPDWGSVLIHYKGPKIDHEGLLKYIISYRNHSGFAEHCAERMFVDILKHCQPKCLTVYCRYTKRGGLDINPFRSNFEESLPNSRMPRQ